MTPKRCCESRIAAYVAELTKWLTARHQADSRHERRYIRGRIHHAIRLVRTWRRIAQQYNA